MTRKMMPTPAQRRLLELARDHRSFTLTSKFVSIQACYRAGWITGELEITQLGLDALAQVEGRV